MCSTFEKVKAHSQTMPLFKRQQETMPLMPVLCFNTSSRLSSDYGRTLVETKCVSESDIVWLCRFQDHDKMSDILGRSVINKTQKPARQCRSRSQLHFLITFRTTQSNMEMNKAAGEHKPTHLPTLPNELIQDIAQYAGINATCDLRTTCKRFKRALLPVLYRLIKEDYAFPTAEAYKKWDAENADRYPLGPLFVDDGLSRIVYKDDACLLRELLDRGMSPHSYNREGHPLLYLATYHSSSQIFDLLLERGADVNSKSLRDGRTAMDVAAETAEEYKMQELLQRGASVMKETARIRMLSFCDETILQAAWKAGVNFGVVDPVNSDGAFHSAAVNATHDLIPLLAQGMPSFVSQQNWYGQTALWTAMETRNGRALTSLLKAGIDINVADNDGETALHVAARLRLGRVLKELLIRGANVHAVTNSGCTALHCLAIGGIDSNGGMMMTQVNLEPDHSLVATLSLRKCENILVQAGIDVNAVDNSGLTASDYTRLCGH